MVTQGKCCASNMIHCQKRFVFNIWLSIDWRVSARISHLIESNIHVWERVRNFQIFLISNKFRKSLMNVLLKKDRFIKAFVCSVCSGVLIPANLPHGPMTINKNFYTFCFVFLSDRELWHSFQFSKTTTLLPITISSSISSWDLTRNFRKFLIWFFIFSNP